MGAKLNGICSAPPGFTLIPFILLMSREKGPWSWLVASSACIMPISLRMSTVTAKGKGFCHMTIPEEDCPIPLATDTVDSD